jgi:tRNA A-37 threonylcarbamoyl transferase component Bud32
VGPGEYSARKQLDALASGAIDTATFLRSTLQRFRFESEESWEVLALLDQYHRLGKIPTEVFREVKVTIGEYAWRPRDANGKPLSKFNLPESPAPSPKATPAARQASPEPAQAGATRREMSAPTSKPLVAPRRTVPVTAPAAAAPPVNETADQTPRTAKPVRPTESENSVPPAPDPEIITQQLRVGREQRDPPPANPRPSPAERESIAEPEASIPPFREAAAEAAPHEIRVGDMLRRRYRIDGVIGTGSVGTVYEASDSFRLEMPPSGQRIAIKVFHAHLARRIETLTELRRDFQTLQSLSHPNILRAFEFERDHQFAFVTTELLNGATLERVLGARTDRPLQRPHALSIIRDVGAAIAYAHSRGVVHGDISPRAVFLTARGELRVLDFAAAHKQPNSPFSADVETFGATAATPAFASCQVLENDRPRVQDDIYSLACVAALLLGGRHPFDGRSAVEARIARVRPRRPAGITERQWHALRNALRFDRDKRPTDVQEWLKHMGLEHAAARLPPVNDLVEAPSGTGRRFGPGSVLFACVLAAAACYFVAVENDWVPSPDLSQLRAALLPAESTSHPVARADLETQAPPAAVEPPVSRPARTIPATQSAQPKAPAPTTTPSVASGSATAPNRAAALPSPTPKTAPANSSASGGGAPATVATHAKVEMAGDSLEVEPGSMAKVLVRRRGSLRGTTSFQWWTESGTAKPSKDFVPVLPRIEQMADGQATAVLLVSVTDAVRTRDKSFYVEIDATDGGAEMSGRTLTMVTLPANN